MTDKAKSFRPVKSVEGMMCTSSGDFLYNGKPKKVSYVHTVTGRRATAKVTFRKDGVTHYFNAAKLIAEAWKANYYDGCCITYKDGNIHNICSDNLTVTDGESYKSYRMRNSVHLADDLAKRKRKLQIIIEEAGLTLEYLTTKNTNGINQHVEKYLYRCLMDYAMNTLHLGEQTALIQVPETIARMYEVIMNGMCLYNYERWCKKLLLNYKKKGNFGHTGDIPKPIEINVEQLNLDCLWEKYKRQKSQKSEKT